MKTIALSCLALLAPLAAFSQPVKAPPLPPGSHLVKQHPGLNPAEEKRDMKAHHHKGHVNKDYQADDTLTGGRAVSRKTNGGKK